MDSMTDLTLLFIAIISFVATNLDDLFVLMLFFAHPDYKNTQIIIGQYIGISSLILISTLGYFFKFVIPSAWIGLLGIFPIIIGLKNLINLRKNDKNDNSSDESKNKGNFSRFMNSSLISVAVVSFTNGGDNIGVYAPLFATLSIYQLYFVILIFLIMIGIWCFISYRLVNNRRLGGRIREYGHLILPFVLIIMGISILIHVA
jgi:cadmium resistance transport/sequestration family protein